jgi:hypothetical protein
MKLISKTLDLTDRWELRFPIRRRSAAEVAERQSRTAKISKLVDGLDEQDLREVQRQAHQRLAKAQA